MAMTGDREERRWVAALLGGAVLMRGLLLVYPGLDSDVAAIGLMAMHFLRGDLAAISWGVNYGGTLEPLLAAPLFALFGPSPLALDAAPALVSLAYVYFMSLIGRRLWGRAGGLAAMALCALGPYYLLWFSATARGLHAELLALGALLVWLTLRLLETAPRGKTYRLLCLAFGLTAGVGFWTNLLMAGVIAPALAVLWRRHGRLPISLAGMLMLGGFLLGSSPLWWHNLQQDWGTLAYSTRERPNSGFATNLLGLITKSLPVMTGSQTDRTYAWVVPGLSPAVLLVWGGALAAALAAWGRDLWGFLHGRADKGPGALLLLTAMSVSAVFCILGGAEFGSHRYLLALYLVLPLPLARAFSLLRQRGGQWSRLAGLGLGLVLISNLVGAYLVTPLGDPEQRRLHKWQNELAAGVIAHFQAENVTHVYCPGYWQAPLLTFLSREQIVFVQPFGDRRPQYLDEFLRAREVGLVVLEAEAHLWRRSLSALGATWREKVLGDTFVAFTGIRPPETRPLPLSSRSWRATAHPQPETAAQAWDYNATTRWSPGQTQRPGQWYRLDMGREVEGVCQVMVFYGSAEDRPHILRLEASSDGQTWRELLHVKERAASAWWSGDKPVFTPDNPWEELRFAPRSLRYLRLSQEGEYPHSFWSLCEILVGVESDEPAPAPPQWASAAGWLAHELPGTKDIRAEPSLAAWLPQRLRARLKPQDRPTWLREYLSPERLLPEQKPLYLALDRSRLPWAESALAAAGWRARAQIRHGVALLEAIPPRLDSDPPGPNGSADAVYREGTWLIGNSSSPLAGLLLDAPGPPYISPGELALEVSVPDDSFKSLAFSPLWPEQLYCSGWLPMAARPYPLKLNLPEPVSGNLRLSKAPWAEGPMPPRPAPRALSLP